MGELYVQVAAIICVSLFFLLAVFQLLLTIGFPFGEASMGGFYKILPKPLRIVSAASALILVLMGFVFLQHARIISFGFHTSG
ncbi:hypothetical protein [Aquibacillus rhizosphaerae]|uniref:Uncharacterized protein n=1 Tax=Aquibacillus rhizosphaerae TaxID=3051431 RepID=A0ABT7LAT8_9BACI|nr:hypothetical protein [Aquibacillus sp. LR5S19]MDL4842986.1 hypothetical protein [Aquibacillus sp. LR5S19]